METQFTGVSLGATVSNSRSWAHDLDVSINDTGIAVSGPGTQPSALPWSAVKHFSPGFTLAFPDGRPATELEVTLPDRSLSFLVPSEQLPASGIADLVRFAATQSKEAQRSAVPEAGQQTTGSGGPAIPPPPPGSPSVPLGYTAPPDRSAAGRRAATSAAASARSAADPVYQVGKSQPPAKQARKKNGNRRMWVGAGAVVVAAAVAVVVILMVGASPASRVLTTTSSTRPRVKSPTTTTTSPAPARQLSGPPALMSPASAINEVLVRGSDVPGWKADPAYPGYQEIPGALAAESEESIGSQLPPSEAVVIAPSYVQLQECSNLALDHLQLWTGNYYAGGPPTYSSNTYEPSDVNESQAFTTPQIYSFGSEVATSSVQAQDLALMAAPSFTGCLDSFFISYLRGIESQDSANADNVTVVSIPVISVSGVETLEWVLNANLISGGDVTPIRQHLVILGAGRLEQFLASTDSADQPIASATWSKVIHLIQHRMQVLASKK